MHTFGVSSPTKRQIAHFKLLAAVGVGCEGRQNRPQPLV